MPNAYKVAGQVAPAANQDTVLFTVGALKQFLGSTLNIVNRNTAGAMSSFRVAVVPAGETLAAKHYIEYEKLINARDSKRLTIGMTLNAGDTVVVRASSADLSFTLFGSELS